MSRKYSAWASNQPLGNPDLSMMRLTTVAGNEQDQRKYFLLLFLNHEKSKLLTFI